jgi:hypothetical protein
VERLFGDVDCDASDAAFLFGREGQPLYVPGPRESPAQIRHRIEQLRSNIDVEKFEFVELNVGPNAELE